MAQDFSLRYPLIQGQGNFGCFTNDTKVTLADGRNLSFEELLKEDKEGKKNYTKTQPIQFDEFKPCIEWWKKREANERAWKIKVEDVLKYDNQKILANEDNRVLKMQALLGTFLNQ